MSIYLCVHLFIPPLQDLKLRDQAFDVRKFVSKEMDTLQGVKKLAFLKMSDNKHKQHPTDNSQTAEQTEREAEAEAEADEERMKNMGKGEMLEMY